MIPDATFLPKKRKLNRKGRKEEENRAKQGKNEKNASCEILAGKYTFIADYLIK